jgi:hypothetical protein
VKGRQISRPEIETLRKERPCDRLGEDEDFDVATLQNWRRKKFLGPVNTKPFRVSFVTAFNISPWQNFLEDIVISS